MANIEELTQLADSTPEDAAKTLENSSILNVEPTAYKQFKEQLNTEAEKRKKPREAEPIVKEWMAQSPEHTSLALPDLEQMNYAERQLKRFTDYIFEKPTIDQKVIQLSLKKAQLGQLTEAEEFDLQLANQEQKQLAARDYGLDGPLEEMPKAVQMLAAPAMAVVESDFIPQVAGAVSDFVQTSIRGAKKGAGGQIARSIPLLGVPIGAAFGVLEENFDQMVGSSYNELSNLVGDDGQPIQIDHETKKGIALGVGVVSTALESVGGYALAKTSAPFLRKFYSPTMVKEIVNNPANAALKKTLVGLGTAAVTEGATEGAQEIVNIVGEEIGRTWDGTEISLFDGLTAAAEKWRAYAPRVGQAAAVGAVAGGVIASPGSALSYSPLKAEFKSQSDIEIQKRINELDPVKDSVKVLQTREVMKNMAKVLKSTKMTELSPEQSSKFIQTLFKKTGAQKFWIGMDDPKLKEKVLNFIDPTGAAMLEMNVPIAIEPDKAIALIQEDPSMVDQLQLTPQGKSPLKAEQYVQKLDEAEKKRTDMKAALGAGAMTEEDVKVLEQADASTIADPDISDEVEFLNEPVTTELLAQVLPEGEVQRLTETVKKGRQIFIDQIYESAQYEMEQVRDIEVETGLEVQREIEASRIENDPNFAIVDAFHRDVIEDSKGKALSQYVIDPALMSDKQKLQYLENDQLKEHKMFVKGGWSPDEAAQRIGLPDGETFLKVMSRTPRRQKVIDAMAERERASIEKQVDQNLDFNKVAFVEALEKESNKPLVLLEHLRTKGWPAFKGAIKRIALPPPNIADLRERARSTVSKMKVSDVSVNQFRVGARKSQRVGVQAILDGKPLQAHQAFEAQALNLQFQKEAHIAIGKINKGVEFVKYLKSKKGQAVLNEAGKDFVDATNEILDLFNLDPSKKGTAITGSFAKWVRKQVREGRGDFSINPNLTDIRESLGDLSVEAATTLFDRLKAIEHVARWNNKLQAEFRKEEVIQTRQAIAAQVAAKLQLHAAYNTGKIPPVQETESGWHKVKYFFYSPESLFTNAEHLYRQLDEGKLGGYFQELFWQRLKGDGKWNEKSGYTKELKMTKQFLNHMNAQIEAYGQKDFDSIEGKIIVIPEFAGNKKLNNGRLTKGDLMVLWAYGGDAYTKAQREKTLGISDAIMQKVFDRELEKRDIVFMQKGVVDNFKTYREETRILQKETTGQDVDFVEGIPNTWRGETFEGGYVPAKYRVDYTTKGAKLVSAQFENQKSEFFEGAGADSFLRQYAGEQTQQGRLKDRTGSDEPLDTSLLRMIRGNEEIIHDLSYRKAVMDNLDMLRIPEVRENIISVIGEQNYSVLVNTTVEIAGRVQAQDNRYYADQMRIVKQVFSRTQANFSITVLGMNRVSTAIQYQSVGQLLQNVGPKGAKHLAVVNKELIANPRQAKAFYKIANELDPTIGKFVENFEDSLTSNVHKLVPQKSKFGSKHVLMARRAHEKAVAWWMSPMAAVDVHLKIMGALAGYRQFMAGDVEGFDIDTVMAMDPKERHEKAQAYVRQLSRLSLTHGRPEDKAAFQKLPGADFFANFWNDGRNTLNNTINQGRKFYWTPSRRRKVQIAAGMMLTAIASQAIDDIIRGQDNPFSGIAGGHFDLTNKEGIAEAADYTGRWVLASPFKHAITNVPVMRDVQFGAYEWNKKSLVKTVNIPLTRVLSDAATTLAAVPAMLSEDDELSKAQLKASLNTFSTFFFPVPVNGFFKTMKDFEENEDAAETGLSKIGSIYDAAADAIASYLKDPPKDEQAEFLKELEAYEKELRKEKVATVTPESMEIVRQALSDGQWNKLGPNGEAGSYQFTEDRWNEISLKAPDLGLTENGRVAKDQFQQEIAMQWSSERNAQSLQEMQVPVTEESLLGAHMLGADKYVKLFKAPADTKVKTVLGKDVPKQIADFKTVGQVKSYLKTRVAEGQRKLTLSAQNEEN